MTTERQAAEHAARCGETVAGARDSASVPIAQRLGGGS
jgi:hypothetical protein